MWQYDAVFELIHTHNLIKNAYENYSDVFTSGDEDKIKEATEQYASIVSKAMSAALANGDEDIATYFENMYPVLQNR